MKFRFSLFLFSALNLFVHANAQDFEFYPNASYKSDVPTLEQITGHAWGEKITMHHELERYIHALADASPNVVLASHGETWEGKKLYHLIISSEENIARLENVKSGMKKLADPRKTGQAEADQLISTLPAISWLSYGVHGNEISSTDAGLLTAYHLVAAEGDTLADNVLRNSIVIIDPLQNPDGRDRFINFYRQTRGRWPDGNMSSAEHNENWPGGRTNHYLFDMNRDWFAMTQKETQGRIAAYLDWFPQVFVDLHEMGSNSSYYFAPPATPLNPEMPQSQITWLENYGRNNAKWFDRMKFDYFTREVFDSFYPGYGEGWPILHGSVGMTYEQASARGLVVDRDDETRMYYRETVRQHFISSLSTAETSATNREAVLRYFFDFRKSAIEEGRHEEVKEYIIAPGNDPNRAHRLAALLAKQGVEVKLANASFRNASAKDYYGGAAQARDFPEGSFVVSLAQPSKRLIKTLLTKHLPMDSVFIKEQLRRQKKRIGHQIYDITGWSLPLLFDVECYEARSVSQGDFAILDADSKPAGEIHGLEATLAYLIPWGTHSAARALAHLHRNKIRVHSTDKKFTLNGKSYPEGTLIIKLKDTPEDLHEKMQVVARTFGVDVFPTNTSWVTEGVNFGSGNVQFLKKPKIAMAYNRPVSSYSVGWTRYLIEQAYGYPVTIIHANQIGFADLTKFNVLILPNAFGGYDRALGGATGKIKDWIRAGGTLISYGNATHWLTEEKVGLLSTKRELKGGKPEAKTKDKKTEESKPDLTKPFDVEKAIQPDREFPVGISGAIAHVTLDVEHWLAFGYDGDANVMVSSGNIFTPVKLDKGVNVGLYKPADKLNLSGFFWEETEKQLGGKAYLMHQRHGRGNVVAFAEDPNVRAFCDGLNLLLINAIFFGPAH